MKAVRIERHGQPLDVAQVVDIAEPAPPARGEVLIQMLHAPINPFDLRIMRGVVPGPSLPSIMGSEGVARVLETGEEVSSVKVGDLVHLPNGHFGWRERLTVPAQTLFPLPPAADLQQLSMLRVNPPTAALLLSEFVDLQPGDWIIQDAANSAVGRCVIAFARARGLRTINLVRRPEVVDAVKAAGGDAVIVEDDTMAAQIAQATGGAPIRLGLEGIGGPWLAMVSGAVSPGGTVAVYSAMSEQPGIANQLDIIFRNVAIRGFWLAYPQLHASGAFQRALRDAAGLIATGKLHVQVAATYRLDDLGEALRHAGQGAKVLLTFT